MSRKKVALSAPSYDIFYCTIGGWQRTYAFQINRLPLEFKGEREGELQEQDCLQVFGTIRHHLTSRRTRRLTGQGVELSVYPFHDFSREDWNKYLDQKDIESVRVGGVWTEKGKLFGLVSLAADAYYSLIPCLAANHFKELELNVRQMKGRRGNLDGIEFSPQETPKEDIE